MLDDEESGFSGSGVGGSFGAGGCTVEGISPPNGPKMQLHVEVCRNEVLLQVSGAAAERPTDVAVGLDDLQDAMEGVINRA